jgi:hypothetical protein
MSAFPPISPSLRPPPTHRQQMDGHSDPQTPEPSNDVQAPRPSHRFEVGDTVHVFQGTGAYVRGPNTIAFIGTVVGYNMEDGEWLVRILSCPALFFLVFGVCV